MLRTDELAEPSKIALARLLPASARVEDLKISEREPAPRPMPAHAELRKWLVETLGERRGVLCAMPSTSESKGCVHALDERVDSGTGAWWLRRLQTTDFSTTESYSLRPASGGVYTTCYRLLASVDDGFAWFPSGNVFGQSKPGQLDRFLHFGLSAIVTSYERISGAPAWETQLQHLAIEAFLWLEVASVAIAPAVFAIFALPDANGESAPRHVVGNVVTLQGHVFTLRDLLRAYAKMKADENVALARGELGKAVCEVVTKLRHLANRKILKLNLTPRSIVFVPELIESAEDADEWEVCGVFFSGMRGRARLAEFDTRLCKRLAQHETYDADCAFVTMLLVFVATVRAELGNDVARAVLSTCHVDASVIERARERFEGFEAATLKSFCHNRAERDPITPAVFRHTFTAIRTLLANATSMPTDATDLPLFEPLCTRLLDTSVLSRATVDDVTASSTASATSAALHKRLQSVIDARRGAVAKRG